MSYNVKPPKNPPTEVMPVLRTHVGAQADMLFAQEYTPRARSLTYEVTKERLDGIGKNMILEGMASGLLPNELALMYNVPLLMFRKWVIESIPDEEFREAMRVSAETLMAIAKRVLTLDPDSAAQGAQLRAYSDRLVQVAERLDAEAWAQQKAKGDAPPSVMINIQGDVPGLAHVFNSANNHGQAVPAVTPPLVVEAGKPIIIPTVRSPEQAPVVVEHDLGGQ
jgi:hypothetical protein